MFSNWSLIPNAANINFEHYTIRAIADGSKVFASSSRGGDVYYSFLNGTTYTNWLPVPNGAGVVFLGSDNLPFTLDYTADGTTLCAQNGLLNVTDTNTDTNIYYSIYNGTTYSSWISVPNPNNFKFVNRNVNASFTYWLSTDGTKIIIRGFGSIDYEPPIVDEAPPAANTSTTAALTDLQNAALTAQQKAELAAQQKTIFNVTKNRKAEMYYSLWNGKTYTEWTIIPNTSAQIFEFPTVSMDNTKIIAYSTTSDEVYYSLYANKAYTNFVKIPNTLPIIFDFNYFENMSASNDLTKVYMFDASKNVYYSVFNEYTGEYQSWVAVPNPAMITTSQYTPRIPSSFNGNRIYTKDTDNYIYYSAYNGTSYSHWTKIPSVPGIDMRARELSLSFVDDGSKAYLATLNNSFYYSLYNNGMYNDWRLVANPNNIEFYLDEYVNPVPNVLNSSDGTTLFAQSRDSALNSYYATFNGSSYTNWTHIPNAEEGIVFIAGYLYNSPDGTKVFNKSTDGNFYVSGHDLIIKTQRIPTMVMATMTRGTPCVYIQNTFS